MKSPKAIPGILRQRKLTILAGAILAALLPAHAVDEVLLKSGNRVSGTIIAQSKDRVVMRVGEGTVVFAKRAIRRIYDGITANLPVSELLGEDELPAWWIPLTDLYAEDWVTTVDNIPATPIESGLFENVPYLSFQANTQYELNIYGDPARPAAIEIGHYSRTRPSEETIAHCREFLVSYLTDLAQIKALYALDAKGGSRTEGGLTIQVTPPEATDASDGWWLLVYDAKRVSAARESGIPDFRRTSESLIDTVRQSTEGKTSWRKWVFTDALQRLIPMENIEVR